MGAADCLIQVPPLQLRQEVGDEAVELHADLEGLASEPLPLPAGQISLGALLEELDTSVDVAEGLL